MFRPDSFGPVPVVRTGAGAAILACALAVAPAVHADAPPSAPGGVRATLYDGAGGELFWRRSGDDRGVVGYEVTLNGASLGVRDATSLYDPSLRPGTSYTFTVSAVDTAGQRSAPVTATLGGEGSVDTGAAPARPRGLDAAVYSDSAIELTWQRPVGPRPTWRIERDGVRVTTTIGPSFFLDDLVPGRDYRYEVVAVNGDGLASSPAAIVVRTGADARVTPIDAGPEVPVTADTRPEIRPRDPGVTVYSSTAAELFWNPQALERPVIERNEIRRDGVLIDTVEGGFLRSYFDDTREPGRAHTYTITAISRTGNASATVSDDGFDGGGPAPGTVLEDSLPGGAGETLATLFDVVNAVPLEHVAATALRLADPQIRRADGGVGLVSTFLGPDDSNFATLETFACPNGGELEDIRYPGNDASIVSRFSADDCGIGPIRFTGDVFIDRDDAASTRSDGTGTRFAFSDVLLSDSRDGATITFVVGGLVTATDPQRPTDWSASNLSVDRPDGAWFADFLDGSGADENNRLPDGSLGLTVRGGGIDVGPPFGPLASVRTLGPFEFGEGRAGGAPTVGRLSIESDGTRWLIDALDGNPATFTLTRESGGGAVATSEVWSDGYRLAAPSPEGIDVGF